MALPQLQRVLDTLESRGCRLQRSPAGVHLFETSISCWRDILEDRAARMHRAFGRRTLVYAQTTSTNDIAWQHAGIPGANGLLVLADQQTAGRGRLGRTWSAASGKSILLSLLLQKVPDDAINRLTLLAGLAVCVALERAFEAVGNPARPIEIKWPNDLLIDGRKTAGVLVERRVSAAGHAVVVGIGINVHQSRDDFPADIRATSLAIAGAAPPDRLMLVTFLLDALAVCFDSENLRGNSWIDEWKKRCRLLYTLVSVRSGSATVTGHVMDVSPLHGLIVKDGTGAQHFFSAQTSSLL